MQESKTAPWSANLKNQVCFPLSARKSSKISGSRCTRKPGGHCLAYDCNSCSLTSCGTQLMALKGLMAHFVLSSYCSAPYFDSQNTKISSENMSTAINVVKSYFLCVMPLALMSTIYVFPISADTLLLHFICFDAITFLLQLCFQKLSWKWVHCTRYTPVHTKKIRTKTLEKDWLTS